jgi:hypothetical protein
MISLNRFFRQAQKMDRSELFPYNAGLYTDKLGYPDFQPKNPEALRSTKLPGTTPLSPNIH